ncbi:MAG: hypothetical protein A2Z97_07375 [Bdellovibrionales bacterium GWB1_52_6]|nr:MAG: hypothetical protein A2Z97_07375 [Bdellovibrionales bacterium GWB1_52_6]OFZ06510.1 MAG: hypothetical protein A2X97_16965 [Bdellovibrionales bacterium GWA1_52_35]HCM39514.1 hypothetical protein [Bdellovibrionales bacterium]
MKVGVVFCKCGTAITEKIDADQVQQRLKKLYPDVDFVTVDLACSEGGKEFVEAYLKDKGIDRMVISACSPRDHENTFKGCMHRAGRNPYLMQMVNAREQIAWVTADKVAATDKAVRYLDAAVRRVMLHDKLESKQLDICPDVLIIGAGPAGLKTALTLAESGRKVIIVEKTPVIGGMPVRYEDTFPKMECGPCMLEPIMGDILHGPHSADIELLTMAEVQGVVGSYGNFIVQIKQRPRYVDPHKCIGCGECTAPCPVSTKNPFNYNLDEKKAVGFTFAGALPNSVYIDPEACVRFKGESCQLCKDACPVEGAFVFDDKERVLERNVGAIAVMIGSEVYDCSRIPNLGYGKFPEVYNSVEFERILSSTGPTSGEIKSRTGKPPENVAIVHCVGSLDSKHKDYCSSVCCQAAFKFSHLIDKRVPTAKITHFFKELVVPGKEEFHLFHEAQNNTKTKLIRYGSIEELKVSGSGERISMEHPNGKGATEKTIFDMVVLCPAMIPAEDTAKVGKLLELTQDKAGFFDEMHGRMDSSLSKVKGVCLAGTCQAPGDIQRSINQGLAAAGTILSGLVPGRKLEIDPIKASVDAARCSGCRVCNSVCPYKAISFDPAKKISHVNEVLCMGCGTCVAACPVGVIKGNHFSNQEIMAEIDGVLS